MREHFVQSKMRLLLKMQNAILVMNYIKALDTGIKKVNNIPAKNYYHSEFVKQVYNLRQECSVLREELLKWFELEKENNLEIDLQLRANYRAIKDF